MGSAGTKTNDNALQDRLRWMAQEVLSEITGLDPSRSKELLGLFVRFGPEPKPVPENFIECYEAWRDGYLSTTQAAEECGISRQAFYRAAKRQEQAADCGT